MKIKTQKRKKGRLSFFSPIALFIFLFAFAVAASAQADTRLAATWQVVKYDISAELPTVEAGREMSVKATLEMRNVSGRPANSLTLRISPNATISTVTLNGNIADFARSEEKFGSVVMQRIALRPPAVAAGGSVTAVVDYKLAVRENGGLNAISAVGSHFLPMSFWYPTPNSWYFARGADHAPTRLRVTAPSGLRVVSTGNESSGVFDQKLLVQPFFAAGKWQEENVAGVSVFAPVGTDAEGKKRASELAQLAADAVAFYSEVFGSKPDTPLRIVTVGRGSGYHSGGTILIDSSTLARPKIDSLTAMNIAEGVVKLWIGDSVNVSGDGYGVVREGLPRYFANQFIEHKFGNDIADMERTRQRIAYSAVSRRDEPLNMVAPLDDYYFAAVANKGAMVWRLLQRKVGQREFLNTLKESMRSGSLTLADLRAAFPGQKEFLDKMLDERTEGNLLVGLPRQADGQYSVAVRNTGSGDVTVDVRAFLANGETMSAPVTIRATSFGEVNFRTTSRIERVEIDPEKFYPQIDYSDDIAPRETTDSDLLLAVKRDFDRQAFADAEKTARTVLRWEPRFDDVRVLLARSLLAQNRLLDAEREFNLVLAEKLPGARSMAWAAAGLADVLSRTGRNDEALRYASEAIRAEGEYGASLLARNVRNRLNRPFAGEDSIRAYFAQFDRAAISNRKAEIDALILPGEIARFASGISGNAVEWKSDLKHADVLDADTVLVEAAMSVRLLNREIETGMAVYRLVRTGGGWRMSAVEIFEVR